MIFGSGAAVKFNFFATSNGNDAEFCRINLFLISRYFSSFQNGNRFKTIEISRKMEGRFVNVPRHFSLNFLFPSSFNWLVK